MSQCVSQCDYSTQIEWDRAQSYDLEERKNSGLAVKYKGSERKKGDGVNETLSPVQLTSHHISSHHITSLHITSHHITSHSVMKRQDTALHHMQQHDKISHMVGQKLRDMK